MKLRTQQIRFVLGLLLPFLLFVGCLAVVLGDRESRAVERGLRDMARAVVSALDLEIGGTIDSLQVLGASHALDGYDDATSLHPFDAEMDSAILRAAQRWRVLALFDADGRPLFIASQSRSDSQALANVAALSWFRQAKATERPAISGSIMVIDGQATLPIAVPVKRDGRTGYVLAAFYDIHGLSHVFAKQELGSGWSAALVDESNIAMVSTEALPVLTVSPASAAVTAATAGAYQGRFESRTEGGEPAISHFVRSPLIGWTLVMTMPRDALLGSAWRLGGLIAAAGIALLLVGLGLALRQSRRLTRDIASLVSAAHAIGNGRPPPTPEPSGIAELEALRGAMGHASALLRSRQDELERADEELRRSEERHRGVVEATQDLIWIHKDGKLVFLNPAAARALGAAAPETLIGRDALSVIHPDEHASALERRSVVIEAGERSPVTEFRLVGGDGRQRVAEIQAMPFWHEAGPAILCIGHDVTERKRAEADLRLFRSLIDGANDAIEVIDPHTGRFLDVNDKDCQDLGYTREELLSLAVSDVDPLVTRSTFAQAVAALRTSTTQAWQGTRRRKDGSTFSVDVNMKLMQLDRDYVVAMVRDTTEREQAEAFLRQAQKMEAVGQLTGGVAHDFNNLLAVVIGNAEMLLDQLDPDDRAIRPMLSMIENAALRGAALTQRLLAFSRQQMLKPEVLDINQLARAAGPLLRRTLGEAIDIRIDLAADLRKCRADASQIENALINLAVNARDAMPNGGTLTIRTANVTLDAEAGTRAVGAKSGAYVTLSVSDTGIGMPPEVRDRAFEPFFTTKEVGKGTGLGLSMVYGFAKQSGGHVAIDSEVGKGTTITIYLSQTPADSEDAAADDQGARGGGETVLLVEDEADVREVMHRLLSDLGYKVIMAPDGEAALAVTRSQTAVDLVLTDVVMPGEVDGWQLAQAVWRERSRVPVLFVTGYTDNPILQRANIDERVRVLTKPVRRRDLAAALRRTLENDAA